MCHGPARFHRMHKVINLILSIRRHKNNNHPRRPRIRTRPLLSGRQSVRSVVNSWLIPELDLELSLHWCHRTKQNVISVTGINRGPSLLLLSISCRHGAGLHCYPFSKTTTWITKRKESERKKFISINT